MAIVSQGFELSITLLDTGGNPAVRTYDLQSATYAEAITDSDAIIALLQPITLANISTYTVKEKFVQDAFVYPAFAQVENQASVVLRLATFPKTETIYIPAPVDGLFVAATGRNYNVVDTGDADLLAYVNLYRTAGEAFISDGEVVTPTVGQRIVAGKRIHKASTKG